MVSLLNKFRKNKFILTFILTYILYLRLLIKTKMRNKFYKDTLYIKGFIKSSDR